MPETVIPQKNLKILEQGAVRNTLGAGKDLLRRGYWGLALGGASSPFASLRGTDRGEMEAARQDAMRDIEHRAGLRSNARGVRRAIREAEDPQRKKHIRNRIITGVAAAVGAAGVSLSAPAVFHDSAAAVTDYKSAYHTEVALADRLPADGRAIILTQLRQAKPSVDSRWNDSSGGQQLSSVAREEAEVLSPGYWTPIKNAQRSIAGGNAAGNDGVAMLWISTADGLGTIATGGMFAASVAGEVRRRRYSRIVYPHFRR